MHHSDTHTSEEAKAHAREVLEAAGYTFDKGEGVTEDEHETRVLAGYKAALHSEYSRRRHSCIYVESVFIDPRVSEAAKEHAREYLDTHGAL